MRRAVPDLTSIKPPRAADGAGTAKGETMKMIVIGATGTIGSEVVKALSLKRHEVVRASRNGEVKVTLDDPASVRALFERVRDVDAVVSCAGNASFKPFADLTDADYELGLRSKLMGQVSLARFAKDALRDGGSITLTTGILAMHPMQPEGIEPTTSSIEALSLTALRACGVLGGLVAAR